MPELLTDYQIWASLLTLTALEIVLGIDNLIFLSIVSGRLPRHQQPAARRIGLALALLGRVALLFSLTWIIGLTEPIPGLTHEKPRAEQHRRFQNRASSPTLRGASVSKPERVFAERTRRPKRSHALALR